MVTEVGARASSTLESEFVGVAILPLLELELLPLTL